ncbi:cytochrome c [Azonexus sp. R2A61]|uniref:c-type cytochrome n=1 Tax=Azonexus sp. R2A61 TaxID=2744443 RepID=UPI001F441EE6|nr:cytochrome c [Azonexus sp. R2A61]
MKQCISVIVGASLLLGASGAFAQQAPKPEQLIKWRQSVYQVLAWNSGRIKANVDGQFNKDEVIRAANAIAGLANSGIGGLFAAGSETGKGWKETATKPDFFKNPQRVAELAGNFNREANELAKVAGSGDVAAIKAQFGKYSQTCKACHDDFKSKD